MKNAVKNFVVLLKYARMIGVSTDALIDDKLDIHPNKSRRS